MQIKTTFGFHMTQSERRSGRKQRMTNAAEDTGKGVYTLLWHSHPGKVFIRCWWHSHSGKVRRRLTAQKIVQPHTPSLSLLGIYPKDSTHAGQEGEKPSVTLPSNEHCPAIVARRLGAANYLLAAFVALQEESACGTIKPHCLSFTSISVIKTPWPKGTQRKRGFISA